MITIYHNGRCSKSRGALELLQEKGVPHEVRYYLMEPLTAEELQQLLRQLEVPPSGLLRRSEPLYRELSASEPSEEEWLAHMVRHPELIERPVVVNGDRAVIARPPERVFEIL